MALGKTINSIHDILGYEPNDKSAYDLWLRGKISNEKFTQFLKNKGASRVDRNWGSQTLHIKIRDRRNFLLPGSLGQIDASDEDTVIGLDFLLQEFSRKGIKISKEEGLRDAPKWRLRMLGHADIF